MPIPTKVYAIKFTDDLKLQKWIESIPTDCNYELTGFKHGEYRGETQLKLFLSEKD